MLRLRCPIPWWRARETVRCGASAPGHALTSDNACSRCVARAGRHDAPSCRCRRRVLAASLAAACRRLCARRPCLVPRCSASRARRPRSPFLPPAHFPLPLTNDHVLSYSATPARARPHRATTRPVSRPCWGVGAGSSHSTSALGPPRWVVACYHTQTRFHRPILFKPQIRN